MTKITFITEDETRYEVDAEDGASVMEAAVNNGVPGIDADCGGACACATCHIIVPDTFKALTGTPGEDENSLLDFLDNREENSRLSCQIEVSGALDGMEVRVPAA
ncbi:2Fe-2S iron-sulfur cluster-binding protein [Luteithermobacter gelatinilyticus]|uniref:2Fe-2S iron-sulfur cluster-binding protein n=1 Tax=Luteithermobacter gelatinilyticus TaxID=2582913 RepID=UPI0011074E96|nr:2Fe-2S iron-sulfur cluster-binding protein [Luteithermobacter gelatinilyticus]|tara:strand:- start:1693 stop:2007 length:315 start_codon:yes stop_codon:yes gene_type:complete